MPIDWMVQVERSPALKYTGLARAVPTPAGLPVGLQIAGPRFADGRVLGAAAAYHAARPFEIRPAA